MNYDEHRKKVEPNIELSKRNVNVLYNKGIINEEERTNFHSTVKPVKLMQYLVRMLQFALKLL